MGLKERFIGQEKQEADRLLASCHAITATINAGEVLGLESTQECAFSTLLSRPVTDFLLFPQKYSRYIHTPTSQNSQIEGYLSPKSRLLLLQEFPIPYFPPRIKITQQVELSSLAQLATLSFRQILSDLRGETRARQVKDVESEDMVVSFRHTLIKEVTNHSSARIPYEVNHFPLPVLTLTRELAITRGRIPQRI